MNLDLIFAAVTGSRLYGTNGPGSDIDIRGVCFTPLETLLGLEHFEQYNPSKVPAEEYSLDKFGVASDDLTIYSLSKFFKLCLKANPNILELLFCENPLYQNEVWFEIITKRDLFLSRRVLYSFSGYAYDQLKRIKNHKRWLDNPLEKPDPYDFGMYVTKENATMWKYVIQKNTYKNKLKEYNHYRTWKEYRNKNRAVLETQFGFDTKHASHIYRLLFEAEELLTEGFITLPLKDELRSKVLDVLYGKISYEEIVKEAELFKEKLANLSTSLPVKPDIKGVEKLLIKLHRNNLLKG